MRVLAAVVVLAGCYKADLEHCRVQCGDNGSCPAGFSCGSENLCLANGNGVACRDIPDAAPDPACASVVCNAPPAASCDGAVLHAFAQPGTCSDGTCSYARVDRTCFGGCTGARCNGTWTVIPPQSPPAARFAHTAVWTGTEMIVWGGATSSTQSLATGARFDPSTEQWSPIATTNAPSARRGHTAVWTGTEMIVWGGSAISQGQTLADGGRYNPASNTWTPIPATAAPTPRFEHAAVWTGTHMIVWGGATSSTQSLGDGATYDPVTGLWTAIAAQGAPPARRDHTAVWTGSAMLVWGGSTINTGGGLFGDSPSYDPIANAWTPRSTSSAPASRFAHVAVWADSEMLVWGGATSSTQSLADGSALVAAAWTPLPATGQGARRNASAVWTGRSMLVFGGSSINEGGTLTSELLELAVFAP